MYPKSLPKSAAFVVVAALLLTAWYHHDRDMITRVSITGYSLSDGTTPTALHVATAPTSEGGRVFIPVLAEGLTIEESLETRLGPVALAADAPAAYQSRSQLGALTAGLKLWRRDAAGNDRLSEVEDSEWRGGQVWVTEICERGEFGPVQPVIGTTTVSGTTITGTGTRYLTQLPPGSLAEFGGEWGTVATVTSDTAATFVDTHPGATAAPGLCRPKWSASHPHVLACGVVGSAKDAVQIDPDVATFAVEPGAPDMDQPFLELWPGWRDAIALTDTTGYADGSVVDPGGDFSIIVRAFLFDESQAHTDRDYADNGDILVFLDSGEIKARVVTTGGTYTADSGSLESEAWYLALATFDEGGDLKLYIDGALKDTVATTGTLPTSGNAWRFGWSYDGSGSKLDGMFQGLALFDDILTSAEIADYSAAPLVGSEDGLLWWYPGRVFSGDLLEGADTNADAPLDAALTGGYTTTTAMEGPAGTPQPRFLGPVEHALAAGVDENQDIFRVSGKPIQTVTACYEAGTSIAVGDVQNTLRALLVTTPGLNTFDFCPLHALIRLDAKDTGGDVAVDVTGEGMGDRSFFFDGAVSEADLGVVAAVNNIIAGQSADGGFTLMFWVAFDPSTGDQVFFSNKDADLATNDGLYVGYNVEASTLRHILVSYRSDPIINFQINGSDITQGGRSTIAIAVVFKNAGTSSEELQLYVNGVQDGTSTSGSASNLDASADRIRIGFPEGSASTLDGMIGDLALFDAPLSQAEIREWIWQDKTSHPDIALYYPADRDSVAADLFPSATLVDEINGYDATLTSVEYRGALTPTTSAAIAEVLMRRDLGLTWPALDLDEGIENMPQDPIHVYAQDQKTTVGAMIRGAISGVNGWIRWSAPQWVVPTGTATISAGTSALTIGSGDLDGEASVPALIVTEGEAAPLTAIASASAGTLGWTHTAGASADTFFVVQPQLVLGLVTDPDGASADVTLDAADVLALPVKIESPRASQFKVAHGWIAHSTETILVTSPTAAQARLFARWAEPRRYASATHEVNRALETSRGVEPEVHTVDARFVEVVVLSDSAAAIPRGARSQARTERDLYGPARLQVMDAPAELRDRADQIVPGSVLELDNPDAGGVTQWLVVKVSRTAGEPSGVVLAKLWGALA